MYICLCVDKHLIICKLSEQRSTKSMQANFPQWKQNYQTLDYPPSHICSQLGANTVTPDEMKNYCGASEQMLETCNCMTTVFLDIYRTCIPRQKKNCCALTRLMNCMAISVKTMILMGSWQAGLFSFLKWIKLPRQHEIIDLWIEQSNWWFVIAEFITHLAFLPQK